MLLHQVLEELFSSDPWASEDGELHLEDNLVCESHSEDSALTSKNSCEIIINDNRKADDNCDISEFFIADQRSSKDETLVQSALDSKVGNSGLDLKAAPLIRNTSSSNAQYLYRAAVAAKDIQVSGHGKLSAPALLANCLLSMISLSDDAEINCHNAAAASLTHHQMQDSTLRALSLMESQGVASLSKDVMANKPTNLPSNYNKIQPISCCLLGCGRSPSSKSMVSTIEIVENSEELRNNDHRNPRISSGPMKIRDGREAAGGTVSWGACNLRSIVKRVLSKGNYQAAAGSSSAEINNCDQRDQKCLSICDDHADHGIHGHQGSYVDKDHILYRVKGSILGHGAQEVVQVVSSHDIPVASTFVFEQSCFSSSSSTSSTSHGIKLESAHPWLAADSSCATSPLHQIQLVGAASAGPHSTDDYNDHDHHPSAHDHGAVQGGLQLRLANKRLNLSR